MIQEAQRKGAKGVFGFAGQSGTGKTYSALMFAYGLAGCVGKRMGFLDTENRRGSLYADILPDGDRFMTMDMTAPFHPRKYVEAIAEFEKAGIDTLVIDSISHEWEGQGGCSDIALYGDYTDAQFADGTWCAKEAKRAQWQVAKRENQKFVNALLQSKMNIVVCLRAKEKSKVEPDGGVSSLGIQPICEKNFSFEATTLLLMQDEGSSQKVLRCPSALRPYLGRADDYITVQDGLAVREWLQGGTPMTALDRLRAQLLTSAGEAREALWKSLTKDQKKTLTDDGTVARLKGETP
jgi:hypothetical protein